MHNSSPTLSFLLNGVLIHAPGAAPGRLLLDFLRRDLRSVGTKEGCREGDCGACGVLLGELGEDGNVTYAAVPSCMVLLGHVRGQHVVTIEGINPSKGLSPVQAAVVEHGGSQCGFCTPGFIVSFTGFLLNGTEFTVEEAKNSIAGNLCRCTGYVSLVRAGKAIAEQFDGLTAPGNKRIAALLEAGALPPTFEGVGAKLAELKASAAEDHASGPLLIGGGTDLIVQRGASLDDTAPDVRFPLAAERKPRLQDGKLRIPGGATFEDLMRCEHFTALWPRAKADLGRFASALIRERATVAGNIANASPIADGTAIFLALGAALELVHEGELRTLALADFYHGYKQFDLNGGELISAITIAPSSTRLFSFEKVSKREYLDIATVNTALCVEQLDGVITSIVISAGGVGPTPMLLPKTASFLMGKAVTAELVLQAAALLETEIAPISDVRGSAEYKALLLRQLFLAHFLTLFPDLISESALMEVSA
jgi:xanthine dehydrogenase small subunit